MSNSLFDQIPLAKDKVKEIKEKDDELNSMMLIEITREVTGRINEAESVPIYVSLDMFFEKHPSYAGRAAERVKQALGARGWDVSGKVPEGTWILKPKPTR